MADSAVPSVRRGGPRLKAARSPVSAILSFLLIGCGTPNPAPTPGSSAMPVAALPSGSGESAPAAATARTGMVEGPPLPACVGEREPVALPEAFPAEIPFPPGTVITSARVTEAGGSYVEGYAPLTLVEAARFYLTEIPAAGYVHGRGDSEAHEAESPFSGKGIQGRWIVASIDNCPDAAALSVVTAELP